MIRYRCDQKSHLFKNNIQFNIHSIHNASLMKELARLENYIIGYYNSEKWLIDNTGVFAAIGKIQEYEQSNFGEIITDLSFKSKKE